MCEERRICGRCRQVVWTRHGAHLCPLDVHNNNNNQQQQQQQHYRCARCDAFHDARWTPHFIQPKRAQCQLNGPVADVHHPDDGHDEEEEEEEEEDDDLAEGGVEEAEEVPEGGRQRQQQQRHGRRPVRFLFWDVECAQVAEEEEEEDEEMVMPRVRKHVPLLVCAEVICERCVAAGVDLEREPQRRAPGCCCGGAAWRGGQHRRWLMRPREDAFSDDDDDDDHYVGGEPNPRRLRFFHDAGTGRTAMEQFVDFLLHNGPVNVRTVMLAHNGVGRVWEEGNCYPLPLSPRRGDTMCI